MPVQFNRYVNVSAMKHYFNVSNKYVVNKLFIVLFPWRHRPWSRQQQPMATSAQSGPMFLPPREDINSPDMYIPVMAFVTYILLSTLLAGLQGAFRPELLGMTATNAFAVVIIELLLLKLGTYLLNISNESQWLDLVAYSGYKFVGIIFTIALATIMTGGKGTGGYVGWSVFAYTYLANAFFLVSNPACPSPSVLYTDPNSSVRSSMSFSRILPQAPITPSPARRGPKELTSSLSTRTLSSWPLCGG